MEEKLIKITVRMVDGNQKKFRVTSFEVKPCRLHLPSSHAAGLCVVLDSERTILCKSIQVEQKVIDPAFSADENEMLSVAAEAQEAAGN